MNFLPGYWSNRLKDREEIDALRELKQFSGLIDFYSNDYLGISRDLKRTKETNPVEAFSFGSGGSRLLGGNHQEAIKCEQYLADFYNGESAILYSSGYMANLGLLSVLGSRNDTIVYDEYIHASLRDGIILSNCRNFSFKHNDTEDLEKKLQQASGQIFVVTESTFSMDGDKAPINEITSLSKEYKGLVIVDEAHSVGLYGNNGSGLVEELQLQDAVFARIVTFGKGAGYHGAAVICSEKAKQYLINFSRPFIYTTALPSEDCLNIIEAHEFLKTCQTQRKKLVANTSLFHSKLDSSPFQLSNALGPIFPILIKGGNSKVKELSAFLSKNKIGALPVLSPTVPKGKERIRVIIHSFNTAEEIETLAQLLNGYGK